MQPTPSSVPNPNGPEGQPKPGPSAVPPKHVEAPPRRTGMWTILIAVLRSEIAKEANGESVLPPFAF